MNQFDPHTFDTEQPGPVPVVPQLALALSILVLAFGLSYWRITAKNDIPDLNIEAQNKSESLALTTASEDEPVSAPQIAATAAFVWDIGSQKALYNKNASLQLPLASLTKLMTALVASDILPDDANVPIHEDALLQEGDSSFENGMVFSLGTLRDLMLTTSSNDGAYALAAAAGGATEPRDPVSEFISEMNKKANAIGMTETYFLNPTGLDQSESEAGGYGSARDIAFLVEYILATMPSLLEDTTKQRIVVSSENGESFTATNTNESVEGIPSIIGSKTGYTTLAGGNLVVAFDAGLNRPIVIVVLGSTREGRFSDVSTLMEYAKRRLEQNFF